MRLMVRCGVRRLLQSMAQKGLTGPEPTPDLRRRAAVDALAKETLPLLADRAAAAARLDGSLLAMRCAAAMSLRVGVFTWQARGPRMAPRSFAVRVGFRVLGLVINPASHRSWDSFACHVSARLPRTCAGFVTWIGAQAQMSV